MTGVGYTCVECGTEHPVGFSESVQEYPRHINVICGTRYGGCGGVTRHVKTSPENAVDEIWPNEGTTLRGGVEQAVETMMDMAEFTGPEEGKCYARCAGILQEVLERPEYESSTTFKKEERFFKSTCQSCGVLNEFKDFELLATEGVEEINVCGTIIEQQKHVKGWECEYCCNKHFIGGGPDGE